MVQVSRANYFDLVRARDEALHDIDLCCSVLVRADDLEEPMAKLAASTLPTKRRQVEVINDVIEMRRNALALK